MTFWHDIDLEVATAAFRNTSQVPDERGRQAVTEYVAVMEADQPVLPADVFGSYRANYCARFLHWLAAEARCASPFVVGPARFPAVRARKARAAADQARLDLLEFRNAVLRRNLAGSTTTIRTEDPDAVERLKEAVERGEARQHTMLEANKLLRGGGDDAEKVKGLMALFGIEEGAAKGFLASPYGKVGYPAHALQNNRQHVDRLRARLAQVEVARATPESSQQGAGVLLRDCPQDNRVRLFFEGKPPPDVRDRLKGAGFRWAPSLGCWQAYRNPNALATAKGFCGAPA